MNSTKQFSDLANPGDQFAWELLWKIDAALDRIRLDAIHRKSKIKTPNFGIPFFTESGKTNFFNFETKTEKTTIKSIFVVFAIIVLFLANSVRILDFKSANSDFEHATLDANGVVATLSPKLSQTPNHAR